VIVILVSLVVGITKRIDDQNKERLCRNELALIDNALEQFRDFGFEYKDPFYAGLTFPLDCNRFSIADIQNTLSISLYSPPLLVTITPSAQYDPNFSGSGALYFILSQVPECRQTLDKIGKSLLVNTCTNGTSLTITINVTNTYPFMRIIDPWKTPLNYDYYPDYADYTGGGSYQSYRDSAKRTFPLITSAGADRIFGTNDDIVNRQGR
jgi:hypothetical protein